VVRASGLFIVPIIERVPGASVTGVVGHSIRPFFVCSLLVEPVKSKNQGLKSSTIGTGCANPNDYSSGCVCCHAMPWNPIRGTKPWTFHNDPVGGKPSYSPNNLFIG
jgi:hypothetical protein